jgi:RHS repeat-associated protein
MSTVVFRSAAYTNQTSHDDAGNVLSQTYPDGQTASNAYTAQGWLSGVTTAVNGTPTTLASNLAYTGTGGAFGEITGASLGNGTYTYSATYDLLDRATDLKTTKTSGGTVMFDQSRTFDGAGDVTSIATTMPGATDNQSFCYDEQDRLAWASAATATPPCGGSNTAGTLTAAQYTQTFSYDVLGRLTSGPLGTYTYGSSSHVHAATAIGTAWTSAYDAAGNTTCRAPSSSTTCSGTQTGAQLGYNNEGELQSWQNAPSSPSTTAQFLYDGQGQRVEQLVTQSGTTTTTVYVGDVEEASTTGSTTTTTAYYYMDGKRIGLSVNGTISYLASDGLGSATVTLSGSGSATAAQLFAPYGGIRYSSGTMPTSYGFTGQRADSASGLDYYGARYYDPLAGQFTSGDSLLPGGGLDLWGLSRYAYVGGNPIVQTDPSGHRGVVPGNNGGTCDITDPSCGGGNPGGGGGSGPPTPCWMTGTCVPPPPPSSTPSGSGPTGSPGQPTPTPGPAPTAPTAGAPIPVFSGMQNIINAFTSPAEQPPLACEPDGGCYNWWDPQYQQCVQSGVCYLTAVRGGIDSTGRTQPQDSVEASAMAKAQANPDAGEEVPVTMTDPRWPASSGWIKMEQIVDNVNIHYVYNPKTHATADWKFKDPLYLQDPGGAEPPLGGGELPVE